MDILEQLYDIAGREKEINLLNVFHGVPISCPAVISALGERSVRVVTGKNQIACLFWERKTYLQSEFLPEILRARVEDLNMVSQEVTLGGFEVETGHVGDRNEVRVQPKAPIRGKVKTSELRLPLVGELADISRDGLGIYVETASLNEGLSFGANSLSASGSSLPRSYRPGGDIEVTLRLPILQGQGESRLLDQSPPPDPISRFDRENLRLYHLPAQNRQKAHSPPTKPRPGGPPPAPVELTVHGRIANLHEEAGRNRWRIGVRFRPDEPARPLIAQFIAMRQAEILRELRALTGMLGKSD